MIVRSGQAQDMSAIYALRHQVFVLGQGVPEELERDDMDALSEHACAWIDSTLVGTGRLLPDGTIGRMAVAEQVRGQGVGAAVLDHLEQQARQRGLPLVELHAQVHATGFYDKAGYLPVGQQYLEAGIVHQSMRKDLLGALVRDFLAAMSQRDYLRAFPLASDQIEYQNMMLPAVTGKDAMQDTVESLLSMCSDSEWLIHHQVARGNLVMNERTDRFKLNGAWTDLPVAGVFRVQGGLIVSWHDYFDLQTVMTAMSPPADSTPSD